MVYPIIDQVQKDQNNNLYLSGSGFEKDCEFLVSNWPCIRDITYELDSLSKMRCNVQQPRGLFDIPHFPSDLGMQLQLFDFHEFSLFPTWANILNFATEDRLVLEQPLSTMMFSWEQNVALVRTHGYFNSSFQKGSFRVDAIGLILVRVSQCDPESGFCASPTTILDGHSSGEIYTDVHKFKKTSNYYLEIFVLRRSINGYTSQLSVQMVSNDDSEHVTYDESSITEQVDLNFQRSGIFETVYLIKFKVDQPSNFEFALKYGERKTASFPLKGNTNLIQNELHLLSNTECKSLGNMEIVFHENFESSKNHEVTGNVNPFCGLFALETKSPYLQKLQSSRVRSNSKLCFAFRGALENYATLNIEAKKGKSRKIYNIEIDLDNIDPTLIHNDWRYQCQEIFNPVMEYIGQEQDSLYINNVVFHPTEKSSMFLDDIYLGESIGFFTRVQENIGARPSGEFIVHYGVTWKNANLGFDAQLQITIQSENCMDNIPPPEIDGKYDFTQIDEPFIQQYSKKGELIQIEIQKSQYISSSETVTMQYGDKTADLDVSYSDYLLSTVFEEQFGVIASVTITGKCYDKVKYIKLESVDTTDLEDFRVDPANSVFRDIDVKVVRHGGRLQGLLSAKNMQMAAAHKAVFMKCPGNVFSECRANNHCDFHSLDDIEFEPEFEGSSEGSGEIQPVKFIQPNVSFENEIKEDNVFSNSLEVDFGMPFLRRNDRCKIHSVYPQRFSLLGDVHLTISTKNCGSLESSTSISVNNQNCKITSTSFDRVECFLKKNQPVFSVSMRSLESGWAPAKIKIPTGSKTRWSWREMELSDGDDAQIRVQQTMTRGRVEHNRIGFISEAGAFTFEKEFLQPGHYFYSSGWIDSDQTLAYTGEIVVVDMLDAHFSMSFDNEEISPVVKNALQQVTVLDVKVTEGEEYYFVDGSKLILHFNEIPESTGEIKVVLYDQVCENATLINSTTLSCDFTLRSSPSHACNLEVIFSDFGGIFYSEKVTSCPQIVPVVYNPIANFGVGRKGGAEISINGNFKNFFGEDISVVAGTVQLEKIDFTNGELKVLVPELEDGSYNLNVYYRNRWFDTFTLVVSEIFTSTLVQTEVQTSSQSHSITLTGFFVGDIESITIDEQPCIVKYSSSSQIRCKISGIRAGSYIPTILMSLGYAAYEGKIADVSATILGNARSVFPSEGSFGGGNWVNIYGSGFSDQMSVMVIPDKEKAEDLCAGKCELKLIHHELLKLKIPPLKGIKGEEHVPSSIFLISTHQEKPVPFNRAIYIYENSLTARAEALMDPDSKNMVLSFAGVNMMDSITIVGEFFDATCGNQQVKVEGGNATCVIYECSESFISCRLPPRSPGRKTLEVEHLSNGFAKSSNLEVEYGLKVNSVYPLTAGKNGGNTITIRGFGFGEQNAQVEVTVCGQPCSVTAFNSNTDQELVCALPIYDFSLRQCIVKVQSIDNAEISVRFDNYFVFDNKRTLTVLNQSHLYGPSSGGYEYVATLDRTIENESFTFTNLDCADIKIENATIRCNVAPHLSMSSSPMRLISENDGEVSFPMKRFEVIDNWSDQWTWGCTENEPCKPVAGDLVEIPKGAKILLDESTPILKAILISGGILRIKDDNIALNVQYIIITNGGQLLVGSEQEPINSKVEINLHGEMSDHQLPLYGSKVIAVHDGKVEMYGQEKQSWTTLTQEANEGSTRIHVDDSNGWKDGDQLVIATTGGPDSHAESEKVKILDINEEYIRVNRKLRNRHTYHPVTVEQTGTSVTLTAEVINLSRTIVIQGIIGEDKKFGGHLVAAHNAEKMILSYVEFKNVGQAFQLGRYPIHFHITGNEQNSKLIGCSIHRSFNRAVTFHAVHHLRAIGNVAYNIIGHAFFLEDGIETDNYLDSNVAVFTQQGTSLLNTDLWAAGFWITNPDNVLVGNRAVGGTHNGFWYNMPKRPTGPSFTKQICPRFTEMGRFEQNSAHSNGWFGLWIYPVYIPRKQSSCDVDEPSLAVFRDSLFWNNERGAETVLTGLLKFSNMTAIRNRRAGLSAMEAYLPQWPALTFEDSTIIAHLDGETCPHEHKPAVGLETPWKRGSFTADGLSFVNFNSEDCVAVDPCYKAYKHDCANTGRFSRTTLINSTNKIVFTYENEYIIEDTDGSFMESNIPGKILPNSEILPKEKCTNQSEIAQKGVIPVWCDNSVVIRKFGLHKTEEAFHGSDLIVKTEHGENRVPFRQLRFSHASGWIGFILGDSENIISFSGQNHTKASWTMNVLDLESTDNMSVTGENYFGQQVQVDFPNLNQTSISDELHFIVPSVDSLDEEIIVTSFTNASKSVEIIAEDSNNLNFVDIMSLMSGDERKKIQFSSLNHADGDYLIIGENEIVFLDSNLNARHIVIHGKLLVDEEVSEVEINAEMIFVLGIFELNPSCNQRVTIKLSGTWNSPTTEFGGYVGGSKVIYVAPTGEFVANGCTTERKIYFPDKIASGSSNFTSLTVFPGDELIFLPEILDPHQFENVTVTENANGAVEFSPALTYEHEFAVKTKSNLKLIGVDNNSFGGRILSRGALKLANVEFVSFGQRGYNEVSDYRAAVSIDGYQASAKIVLCSFTKSHNSAIYVSNAPNVLLDRNIILDVIGDGIRLNGRGNVALLGNIVANIKHPLLHPKSSTTGNKGFRLWPSGIRSDQAQGSTVSMIDNHVICAEGFGFRTAGDKCNSETSCEASQFITQTAIPNTVRGALHGVTVWGNSQSPCTAVRNFVVSNTVDYGIYIQTDASVQVENIHVRGSTAAISVLIYGANSRRHELVEKSVVFRSSAVILSEPKFNTELEILNRTSSLRQKGTSNKGQIGIIIPTFSSEQNRAPIDEWSKVTSEPALLGGSCLSHVDIYAESPRNNSAFISSNLEAKDLTHPMDLKNVTFSDSTRSVVKILIEKPLEEWITSGESADCIDMDCDGGKKVLVRDLDGSLSEDGDLRGVYFSQSEFAWGEANRGVFDNRVPSSIAPPENESKRGITRSSANCKLVDDSWKCSGVDSNYGILIFESMDKDSTDRRLSPIVIRSSSGFVDMVNGPSNHRGSHGYAAISRISTFFFILRTEEEYEIAATSTLPKNFRLITTNFQSDGNILLHIASSNPQRMEIYRSGVFELPSNVKLNALGEMEFQLPNDSFIPKLENFKNGENYFDRNTQRFHVGIKANTVLDVKTSSTILVSIGAVMEMTPIEFYAHKDLVYLLADFFELDSSQVKVVNVHKKMETSLTGRSNLLGSDEKEVEIEILPDEVDSLSSVISTSTFCKVRQGFKSTFNSTINSFKAQKNEDDQLDPTVSIFSVPHSLVDIGSKNYTSALRQPMNLTIKIMDAENKFIENGDFSIRVTMNKLDSLDSRLEKSVALMMANAQSRNSIPGFEVGEPLSKLERKTLQRWNNRNQLQSENPSSNIVFKKKWKKNKANKSSEKKAKKADKKKNKQAGGSRIPVAPSNNKKPWANKWNSSKKKTTTEKPTTRPQSSTYSVEQGPKKVLDNIVQFVNGSFFIDIPTKYSGLYSVEIDFIENENCNSEDDEAIKMSINLEVCILEPHNFDKLRFRF